MKLLLALLFVLLGPGSPAFGDGRDIPPGYRAFSVAVPAREWQFLSDGDRVDVITTFKAMFVEGRTTQVALTLLQNVLIRKPLPPAGPDGMGTVKAFLNPNESQYLALAGVTDDGKLTLALRGRGDLEMKPLEMVRLAKPMKGVEGGASKSPQTAPGAIPAGLRALAVPGPLKGLTPGSRVEISVISPALGRLLVATDVLILEAKGGTVRVALLPLAAENVALAVFENLTLDFRPVGTTQ